MCRRASEYRENVQQSLTIVIGEKESSKYWLIVLNSLKNREIKDMDLCQYFRQKKLKGAVTYGLELMMALF